MLGSGLALASAPPLGTVQIVAAILSGVGGSAGLKDLSKDYYKTIGNDGNLTYVFK